MHRFVKNKLRTVTYAIPAFFSKPMRYLSVLVFSVLAFYPTIDRVIESTQDLNWQSEHSVIVMIADLLFDSPDSQGEGSDNSDNDSIADDFVSMRVTWEIAGASGNNQKAFTRSKAFPDSIALLTFTPPPKA